MTGHWVHLGATKSRWRLMWVGVLGLLVAVALYGMGIDFLPSPNASAVGLPVCLILGAAAACSGAWWVASSRTSFRGGPVRLALMLPIWTGLVAMLLWCTLCQGVMGAITRVAGSDGSQEAIMTPEHSTVRSHGCPYRLDGREDGHFAAYHLCSNEGYYRAHAGRRVRIQLLGRRTPLGFYISRYRHLAEVDDRAGARP